MKKFLCFLLCIMMFVSSNVVIFAKGTIYSNDFLTAEENHEEEISVNIETRKINCDTGSGLLPASAEDIAKSKEMPDKAIVSESTIQPRTTTWIYLDNYVVHAQSTSYYCVPASAKAALIYLTGSSPSQQEIYESTCSVVGNGVTMASIKDYLNSAQSVNTYISKYEVTLDTMKDRLYAGIDTYDAPPLIGLKFYEEDGWPYTMNGGHCVTIYGAKSDQSKFAIADPWIGYSGSGLADLPWSYSMESDKIHAANMHYGFIY